MPDAAWKEKDTVKISLDNQQFISSPPFKINKELQAGLKISRKKRGRQSDDED